MSHAKERDLVRDLARRVAEIAATDAAEAARQRWRDVNALRTPDRAPIWCKPVGAWKELLPEDALQCEDRTLRGIEQTFRKALIKHAIGDDEIFHREFHVGTCFDVDPPNVWGVDINRKHSGQEGGAWQYDPPIQSPDDFDKLTAPAYTYNKEKTEAALNRADELLGDILPVKRICGAPLHAILCGHVACLRGLTEMMMDTVAEPEFLHRMMAFVRNAVIGAAEQVQASGLLTEQPDAPMTCSDPFGPQGGAVTLQNHWLMTNSQEFDQVSPAMWKAFLLDYQKPICALFGRVGYGCCENLTHKADGVLSIPNLRIFVCSAWTDLGVVLEKTDPAQHVIMWRQKAGDVVFPHDTDTLRRDLEDGLRRLRGRPYQIVLRELQTLAGHPDRLHVWTDLAKELAVKYA